MTRSTSPSRLAAPLGAALGLLCAALPATGLAQQPSPVNNASCSLPASSRKEGLINLPVGEDEGFFGAKGIGQPSIAFVLDSSENMRRLILDVTDPGVVGPALVVGNPPGPTARGCVNSQLNALTYAANPCRDDHDVPLTNAQCVAGFPTQPLGSLYNNAYSYLPYARDNGIIFQDAQYYVHDTGWGANMNAPTPYATGLLACDTAGVPAGEDLTCAACLDSNGYYIPLNISVTPFYRPEVLPKPVFKGRWLNFYPPRNVVGRHVFLQLFGYFQSQNSARQAQFRTSGVAEDPVNSCFSTNLGTAFDGPRDGLVNMGPGNGTTKYRGLCQGGPAQSYWNAVYGVGNMFGNLVAPCPAPLVGNRLPADAPLGTTQIVFVPDQDQQCRAYFADVNGLALVRAICAPYAEAVLQAGSTLASSLNIYDQYFLTSPAGTWVPVAGTADQGICPSNFPCAKGVVILVAGGKPSFDDNIPCEIRGNIVGCPSLVNNVTACGGTGPGVSGNLPRTANFLANNNMMPNQGFPGPVTVNTYIIGFGSADSTLLAAADEGKGKYILATSADGLKAAILEAVRLASTAQITFSSAAFSAVQTKTASQLLVPRFTPKVNKALWPGKFYAYKVVSEDACGCKVGGPTDPCDYNLDGQCGGVFFQDAAGSFIAANSNGVFEKATLNAGQFLPNGNPAVEYWEAGAQLTAATSANRKIYTVIDESTTGVSDGLFDYRDKVIEFNTANAARLAPYLISGPGNVCTRLGNRLNTCLDSVGCASKIIDYVRGKDLFNEDCNNATVDRAQMLGDIYHSAPVVVDPPLGSRSQVCLLGLHPQCLVSLSHTDTPKVPLTAYDDYVTLNLHRDKIAIVGSNDGILHAFRSGRWSDCLGPNNPVGCTPGVGFYDYGDGKELWAFIPPDLLPKLERLVENERELYVDGTPMVRDIWADGSDGSNPDGKKEPGEFHTVAVVSERRGGTHAFALDVTNPSGPTPEQAGFFRWLWPQPNTPADRVAGEAYDDYEPSPPPIGPVRLKNTVIAGLLTYATPARPPNPPNPPVPYEERWVVALNGGYDAVKQRGHTVSLVDVWYGGQGNAGNSTSKTAAIWTFDPKAQVPALAGAQAYSFAASPGLVGFGGNNTNTSGDHNGYFFDTATIGDAGGQLWALRFNDPDPARWAGARAFLNDNTNPTNYCARQPYYSLTSNVIATQGGHLRTLIGSGDRANLTDINGGECSYDNLLACQRRGCALSVTYSLANACGTTSTFTRSFAAGSATACAQNPDVETVNVPAPATDCCAPAGGTNDLNGSLTVQLTGCPGAAGTISWTHQATCHAVAANTNMCNTAQIQTYVCDPVSKTPINMSIAWPGGYNAPVANMPGNGMYSVKIFDTVGARQLFNTPVEAAAYDAAALRPSNLIAVNPVANNGAAALTDNGWAATYVHANPNQPFPNGFNGNFLDERTSTGSTVVGGCAFWSSYLPANNTPVCVPATNGLNTQYHLNFITGGKCLGLDPTLAASSYATTLNTSPPVPPQLTEFVAPDGTISLALVGVPRQTGTAASVTKIATSQELIKESYSLDVTRPEHGCRHPTGPDAATQRTNAQATCY